MQFDFKITVWERIMVPGEYEQKALDMIKDKKIETSNDLFNAFKDSSSFSCDVMHDTSESLSLEDNKGEATIEVLDDDGVTIYHNKGPKYLISAVKEGHVDTDEVRDLDTAVDIFRDYHKHDYDKITFERIW